MTQSPHRDPTSSAPAVPGAASDLVPNLVPSGTAVRPDDGDEFVPVDDAAIGKAFRWSIGVIAGGAAIVAGIWWFASRPKPAPVVELTGASAPVVAPKPAADSLPAIPFSALEGIGIDFVAENGARGDKLLPETMSSGVAVIDFDNDGRPDLFFVNGTPWAWDVGEAPTTSRLYRNVTGDVTLPSPASGEGGRRPDEGVVESPNAEDPSPGSLRSPPSPKGRGEEVAEVAFVDVTAGSGLDVPLHGMGVAAGDYDGDGLVDLFITTVGENRLFRNLGGSFVDVTDEAGVGGDPAAWSTGAAFVDVDRDGDLDLVVINYVKWSRELDFEVDYRLTGVGRAYGPPTNFEGVDSWLYRNDGDGSFTEVGAEAGIQVRNPATGVPVGKGLAVIPCDFDGDGWIDLVVANDTVQNFAFRNLGAQGKPGVFEEVGLATGLAFDRNGAATGAMGIDAAEFRNDGLLAIGVGNFANEMTSLYVSAGPEGARLPYSDDAVNEGIGGPTRLALSFGLFFFDADLDGRLDLLQANGHIEDEIEVTQPSQRYAQPAQLFWNRGAAAGRGVFVQLPPGKLGDLPTSIVGRGAAYSDLDGDGDLDVVITQPKGAPLVLRNDQVIDHRWLRVRLRDDTMPNRDAIGAVVELHAGDVVQRRMVMPTRSYLSQVELPVTFGLGDDAAVDRVVVRWPDGVATEHAVDGLDREIVIERPASEPRAPARGP